MVRDIADIELREREDYRAYLTKLPTGRGGTFSSQSVAHYLNSASNLYERAIKDQLLLPGQNLVMLLPSLTVESEETPFLEVFEMARSSTTHSRSTSRRARSWRSPSSR